MVESVLIRDTYLGEVAGSLGSGGGGFLGRHGGV